MMKFLLLLSLLVSSASSFRLSPRPSLSTKLHEGFGLNIPNVNDAEEITPDLLLGEANYKQWVGSIEDNSFLNRQYDVLGRVRELDLLGVTVESGLLSNLEKQGVDLETLESLLPTLQSLKVLEIAGKNQQLLLNLLAPPLIEGAPLLLPVLSGAVGVGPLAFFGFSGGLLGVEYLLSSTHATIPFVGLSAAFYLGLLLVPLAGVSAAGGAALASVKK
ncbi:hypothetical protein TrST_g1680 [Triparma strigata]|uniref:Uncharacterized protein n=2 Tax=Triparma TaxID=722752 RepID=A0A9W7EQB6_9STRA|nr:hypothetical protein TrST_g1680 [Triparma strigata]